ncbi:MAG: hypothetical protein IJ240_06175, partial [Clostridia bacterium]|nr:hypothetical protein [Clostridia bacterium]
MTRITAFLMAVLFLMLIFPFGAGSGEDETDALTFYSEWTRPEADLPEVLTAAGSGYTVRLYAPSGERFPKDASAVIRDITEEGDYKSAAAQTLALSGDEITFLRVFDIAIWDGEERFEPQGPVRVEMDLEVEGERVTALHFANAQPLPENSGGRRSVLKSAPKNLAETLETEVSGGTVTFSTGSFSAFAIVGYTLEKHVLASDGNLYLIRLTYDREAGIPEGAGLEAHEILPETGAGGEGAYARYVEQAEAVLGLEAGLISYARFFDISIVDEAGNTVQPAEGSSVKVQILLEDAQGGKLSVVHFGEEAEALEAEPEPAENGYTVAFEAASFSVYGIVEAPEPAALDSVKTMDEFNENAQRKFYLSYNGNHYFTNALNSNDAFVETTNRNAASIWYFEKVEGQENQFYIYTYLNGEKLYMHNKSGNVMALNPASKTAFEISQAATGSFYFKVAGQNKWLQHSNGGNGIRLYTDNANATNSRIVMTYAALPDDIYQLDGKSYGIAYHDNSVTAASLIAQEGGELAAQDMLIRPDVLEHNGTLLVAQNADISFWTFHCQGENRYTVSTTVGGEEMYLVISGRTVSLTNEESEASVITAVPGTGANRGKWHFTAEDGYSLNYAGADSNVFNGANDNKAPSWLNLVEKSVLTDEDFHYYSAKKVSVSDEANVYDSQQIVIYTRIWNDTDKRYEFYAVDHDGTLVRCYDTGDGIEWIGSQVNTVLWDFTEYTNADGSKNYYYDIRNTQYGGYLSPQASGSDVLSASPVGVNLNGRRFGESYTTIVAWDDARYAYSGLKAEGGRVVGCPLSEADDFYFAVMNPVDPDDTLTEVETLDNRQYGITMRMIDYNDTIANGQGAAADPNNGGRDSGQTAVLGYNTNAAGLLATSLDGNGYPQTNEEKTKKTQTSLANLYSGAADVNHLFIKSIHQESGYFEYDSTQNFAHLNDNGDFTVYDQIGQVGKSNTTNEGDFGPTRTHGQFMPYNDLTAGRYSTATNQTDVLAQELPDLDPSKDEKLYLIPPKEADYFFGMELSASFTQTPSGLDAWGHDIIFEFSGDDDFWLYVDGELVLDLGGVHAAMAGKVNFRTGQVTSGRVVEVYRNGKFMNAGTYTLRERIEANYRRRNPNAVNNEVSAYLDQFFESGSTVFKDYTSHDMKIFYMERGAGASNLHMRFNLAS